MKKNVTITIDTDLFEKAREQRLNLSGTLNEYLRDAVKPKKADFVRENLTLEIVSFGKNLGLTPEMSVFTHENLDKDAPSIWNNFKDNHSPSFNLFDYMDIRKKFHERFLNHEDTLKPEHEKNKYAALEKADLEGDEILEDL